MDVNNLYEGATLENNHLEKHLSEQIVVIQNNRAEIHINQTKNTSMSWKKKIWSFIGYGENTYKKLFESAMDEAVNEWAEECKTGGNPGCSLNKSPEKE